MRSASSHLRDVFITGSPMYIIHFNHKNKIVPDSRNNVFINTNNSLTFSSVVYLIIMNMVNGFVFLIDWYVIFCTHLRTREKNLLRKYKIYVNISIYGTSFGNVLGNFSRNVPGQNADCHLGKSYRQQVLSCCHIFVFKSLQLIWT